MTEHRPTLPARVLLALVALYQKTAVVRNPRCRFHPTCSTYALEALQRHGALRGSWLAVRRVLRCHPFHPGGVDHVPGAELDSAGDNATTTSIDSASSDVAVA